MRGLPVSRLGLRRRLAEFHRADVSIVAAFIVAAVGLRATALDPEALWIDDAWVAYAHRSSWSNITEIGLSAPGLSIILKLWFAIVGFGEIRAQFIPFVAASIAPALAYVVLRARTARLAAVLGGGWLLFSPIHVIYSARVKQYSVEVVLALVIVHLAWRLLEQPERTERWRSLALVTSAAVLFSFPLASVAGSACLVTALTSLIRERRVERHVWWLAVPAVTTVAWFIVVIRHRQYEGLERFWSGQFVQTDAGLRVTAESIAVLTKDMFEFVSPVTPLVLALACAASFSLLLWRRPLHGLVVALPLLGAAVLSATRSAPLGGGRTDIYLLAGLVLGSALGLDDALDRWSRVAKPVISVLAVGALIGAIASHDQPGYPSQDVPAALADVVADRQPTDTIFVYHNTKWALATYSDFAVTIRPVSSPYDVVFDDPTIIRQRYPSTADILVQDVASVSTEGRVWFIGSQFGASWQQTIDAFLAAGWTETDRSTAVGAEVVLYEFE